jgi:hypothetical protein
LASADEEFRDKMTAFQDELHAQAKAKGARLRDALQEGAE